MVCVGGGGGGGGVGISYMNSLTPGNTLQVLIGAGGSSGVSGGATVLSSGTQSITTIFAYAGAPGSAYGGAGGGSAGAKINLSGDSGGPGVNSPGSGGSAPGFGGGARTVSLAIGTNGSSYGAGGSGGSNSTNSAGGAGYQGAVIIEY